VDIVVPNHEAKCSCFNIDLTLLRLLDTTQTQTEASLISSLGTLVVPRLAIVVSLFYSLSVFLSLSLSAALSFALFAAVYQQLAAIPAALVRRCRRRFLAF
jgi:hypothetical protein